MISKEKKLDLEKQGYRIVGNHSAIKICHWTKECVRGRDVCYKNTFYGINSHQCVQMSPNFFCPLRCKWCWRDIDDFKEEFKENIDDPVTIIEGCIEEYKKALIGFKGNEEADPEKYEESTKPKHFAISLTGEPTFYPYMPQFIDELKKRDITSFLVTNGTNPKMIKRLIEHPPTQLYLTIPAPNEKLYEQMCNPLIKNGWNKIMETSELLKEFPRSVIRLTLVKDENMVNAEEFAEIVKGKSDFVELKGYVWVGHSQDRLTIKHQPRHSDIMDFAKKIADKIGYEIVKEKLNSKVVLLKNPESKIGLNYWEN